MMIIVPVLNKGNYFILKRCHCLVQIIILLKELTLYPISKVFYSPFRQINQNVLRTFYMLKHQTEQKKSRFHSYLEGLLVGFGSIRLSQNKQRNKSHAFRKQGGKRAS